MSRPARPDDPPVLAVATTDPRAITYQTIALAVPLILTVFGIPLLVIAVPIALWYYPRFYASLRVSLTTRELKVQRGVLNREEKTIPLEQITDLAIFQGPIMRHFGLRGIRVETAGQSSGATALVTIVGIVDTESFRDEVLAQRDRIRERARSAADGQTAHGAESALATAGTAGADTSQHTALLKELLATSQEIRDLLQRGRDQA